MSSIDMKSIANKLKKSIKDKKLAEKIGTADELKTIGEGITMPNWWKHASGIDILPFHKLILVAGRSDSGKTTGAIEAMKAAIEQGISVIYVETEGKTKPQDLRDRGLDPEKILLIQTSITEEAYVLLLQSWDAIFDEDPDGRLLVVLDSIGNTLPQAEANTKIDEKTALGAKAKANRRGLNTVIAKMMEDPVAVFAVTYAYKNIGSHGRTNAGGEAANFFSSLTFQCSRSGWDDHNVKKQKVRTGAKVIWDVYKNHLLKSGNYRKSVEMLINNDGMHVLGDIE